MILCAMPSDHLMGTMRAAIANPSRSLRSSVQVSPRFPHGASHVTESKLFGSSGPPCSAVNMPIF